MCTDHTTWQFVKTYCGWLHLSFWSSYITLNDITLNYPEQKHRHLKANVKYTILLFPKLYQPSVYFPCTEFPLIGYYSLLFLLLAVYMLILQDLSVLFSYFPYSSRHSRSPVRIFWFWHTKCSWHTESASLKWLGLAPWGNEGIKPWWWERHILATSPPGNNCKIYQWSFKIGWKF